MNLEEDRIKLRTQPLRDLIDTYEKKRDQLLDKLALIKGHAESLEAVILNLHQKIEAIEKEEENYKIYQKAKQEAVAKMATEATAQAVEEAKKKAKEAGNVGSHPSDRASKLAERKKKTKTAKKKSAKKKTTKKKKPKYQTQKKT